MLIFGICSGIGIITEQRLDRCGTGIDSGADFDFPFLEHVARENHICTETRLGIGKEIHRRIVKKVIACSIAVSVSNSDGVAVIISVESVEKFNEIEGRT